MSRLQVALGAYPTGSIVTKAMMLDHIALRDYEERQAQIEIAMRVPTCSGGIEPVYSQEYKRRIK